MIWLRLFIAAIALTISSDLSAWAQTMQVNSPEGFYDCKGFANGANVRDIEGGCCLPSEQTEATHCRRCRGKIGCEPQNGCGNDAQAECGGCNLGNTAASYACGKCNDNTSCLSGCDNKPYSTKTTVCGVCDGSFNACGDCSSTDQGCGCGKGSCCSATAGGNQCINFGGWTTNSGHRYATDATFAREFYSSTGNTINWLHLGSTHCIGGGIICGGMRCIVAKGIGLTFDAAWNITNAQQLVNNGCWGGVASVGCFDPNATILLEGGRTAAASEVKVADRLFNPLTGRSAAVKRIIVGRELLPMVEVGFDGYMLRVTQEHPVLTKNGMRRANNLTAGDIIVDADGKERTLQYVRLAELSIGQRVFNFELDVDSADPLGRLIVADNITSGDLAVQEGVLPGDEE